VKREMTVLMSYELGEMLEEIICYSDYCPEVNQKERRKQHKKKVTSLIEVEFSQKHKLFRTDGIFCN